VTADIYDASIKAAAALCVTEADALDDRSADHLDRRFRARLGDGGVWLIRRVPQGSGPDVCLRTFSRSQRLLGDGAGDLAPAWYAAAYPDWSTEKVQKSARKALKKARRP
jgi:hypothetical protein